MLPQAVTRPRAAAAQGSCGLHGPHDTVTAAGASLSGAVAITVMEKAASSTSISGDMSLKLAILGYTCRQHQTMSQEGPMAGTLSCCHLQESFKTMPLGLPALSCTRSSQQDPSDKP